MQSYLRFSIIVLCPIEQFEPRANLINVTASPDEDNNLLNIGIIFSLINSEREEILNLVLERVR